MEEAVQHFLEYYYTTLNADPIGLVMKVYRDSSMMIFLGEQFQGFHDIMTKLNSRPLEQYLHNITKIDSQSSGDGVLVVVSGNLQGVDKQQACKFSQMFLLKPTAEGSYYVHNDIFRKNT